MEYVGFGCTLNNQRLTPFKVQHNVWTLM